MAPKIRKVVQMGKYADIDTTNWREQHRVNYQAHMAKRAESDPPGEYRPFEFIYPEDYFDFLELAWNTPEIRAVFEDVCRPDHNGPKGPHHMTDEQGALVRTFEFWFSLLLPYYPLSIGGWVDRLRYMCNHGITDPRDPIILERSRKYLAIDRRTTGAGMRNMGGEAHANFERKGRSE